MYIFPLRLTETPTTSFFEKILCLFSSFNLAQQEKKQQHFNEKLSPKEHLGTYDSKFYPITEEVRQHSFLTLFLEKAEQAPQPLLSLKGHGDQGRFPRTGRNKCHCNLQKKKKRGGQGAGSRELQGLVNITLIPGKMKR